jgi:hypothetical protein
MTRAELLIVRRVLKVMLSRQGLFTQGLCAWVYEVYAHKDITYEDRKIMEKYIGLNRPSKWSSFSAWVHEDSDFYWKCGKIKPRVKWVKCHIELINITLSHNLIK